MASFDDGWGAPYDDQTYVTAYDQLELALLEPIDRQLELADVEQFRPKFKNQRDNKKKNKKKRNGGDDDEWRNLIYNGDADDVTSTSSEEDHERKKAFFQPPLQIQRNSFVKNTLMRFKTSSGAGVTRLAVMGCGEMSLERATCEYLGALGTTNVLSVDIDETALSVGQQLLQKHITSQSEVLASETGLPVLFRAFHGDILTPDHRFADVDAIVSLEVVEHIPLADARKFVDLVLGELMPRIFIFSTPNHEYNTVFGMSAGEFRHDDHKFEMSREQFATWLDTLSARFPHYTVEPPYFIGMTPGNEQLGGATQVAVCVLRDNLNSPLPQNTTPYEMVSQIACRLGARLAAYNLVREAFVEWLGETELHKSELRHESFSPYWLFDVRSVLRHLRAPLSFAATIQENVAVKYLQGMTSHKIHADNSHGFTGFVIMEYHSKQELIDEIQRNRL